MSRYGFRVYKATLHHNTGRLSQPWNAGERSFVDQVVDAAQVICDGSPLLAGSIGRGETQLLQSIPQQFTTLPKKPYVKWLSVQRYGQRVSIRLQFGRGADFDVAMRSGADIPLTETAPGRTYRAELLVPTDDHPTALLAVETIQNTAPVNTVVAWMNAAMWLARSGDPWKRITTDQVTDADFLEELIRNAKDATVNLKYVGSDGAGDRHRTQYSLQAPLRTLNQRDKAVDWAKEKDRGVSGMLHLVGVDDPGDFGFNDGHLTVDDGESVTKIGLSEARDKFTYPLGPDPVHDEKWLAEVKNRFEVLDPYLDWS